MSLNTYYNELFNDEISKLTNSYETVFIKDTQINADLNPWRGNTIFECRLPIIDKRDNLLVQLTNLQILKQMSYDQYWKKDKKDNIYCRIGRFIFDRFNQPVIYFASLQGTRTIFVDRNAYYTDSFVKFVVNNALKYRELCIDVVVKDLSQELEIHPMDIKTTTNKDVWEIIKINWYAFYKSTNSRKVLLREALESLNENEQESIRS